MSVIVTVIGWMMTGMGVLSAIRPNVLVRFLSLPDRTLFPLVTTGRVAIGAALIGAASGSRFPTALRVLGILSIISAIVGLFLGHSRLRALVDWFLALPSGAFRTWGLIVAVLGVVIVIA